MRINHVSEEKAMSPASNALRHGAWVALRGQAGRRVECLAGSVWVTQDRDRRDIVLVAGQGFTLDRPGMAVVSALSDARFAVRDAAGPSAAVVSAGREPQPCSP
jgi:hypothetical protein